MNDCVECRSELEYAGRPLAFTWMGERYIVLDVISDHRIPAGKLFRVRTSEGEIFELTYQENLDHWIIQPYPTKEST